MSDAFVFVDAVSQTKKDLIRAGEQAEAKYVPYMVNRSMSYHADGVLPANEMNCLPGTDKLLQHDYLMESLRPRSRRSPKWYKTETSLAEEALSRFYSYGPARAKEAVSVLNDHDIEQLAQLMKGIDE